MSILQMMYRISEDDNKKLKIKVAQLEHKIKYQQDIIKNNKCQLHPEVGHSRASVIIKRIFI